MCPGRNRPDLDHTADHLLRPSVSMKRHFFPVAILVSLTGCGGQSAPEPPPGDNSVTLAPVVSGVAFPVDLTSPPGDTARLFVVQKDGRIRIVRHDSLLPRPFLDLGDRVSSGSEQGLLGLAFHPEYATNGRFFVDYTDRDGNTHVAEFHAGPASDVADSASEATILTVTQPYSNHNGGQIRFGPDGYLYIGLGDGGSGGDPEGHGQDRSELLASMLRLDVDHGAPYTIPADNPWPSTVGIRPELWNYGLRNPWRFSWDRQTGDLYIADVGQNAHEEVDVAPHGSGSAQNYGWNIMEGLSCYGQSSCDPTGLTLPVLDYGHDAGCSITGGYVYRGQDLPALQGTYFYADYCEGWIRSFVYRGGKAQDQRSWPGLQASGQITSFGEDAGGELYVLVAGGQVYRLSPSP